MGIKDNLETYLRAIKKEENQDEQTDKMILYILGIEGQKPQEQLETYKQACAVVDIEPSAKVIDELQKEVYKQQRELIEYLRKCKGANSEPITDTIIKILEKYRLTKEEKIATYQQDCKSLGMKIRPEVIMAILKEQAGSPLPPPTSTRQPVDPTKSDEIKIHGTEVDKSHAINIFKKRGKIPSWTNGDITFASTNKTAPYFWANPSVEVLNNDWYIILNDKKRKLLYCCYFQKGCGVKFKHRNDKQWVYDIRIREDDQNLCDIATYEDYGYKVVRFIDWCVDTVEYELVH